MFGYISKARHDAIVAEQAAAIRVKDSIIAGLREETESLKLANYALDRTAAKFRGERDAALA